MKKTTLVLIFVFAKTLFCAAIPVQEVQNIRTVVKQIELDLSSRQHSEDFKTSLLTILKKYGVEDVASIALEQPVLMEAFMISPSFGYKKLTKILIKQATNRAELEQILVKTTSARLVAESVVGRDLDDPYPIELVMSALSPSLAIGYGEIREMISAANTLALNHESENINEASTALIVKLAELSSEAFFFIGFDEFIIGQVEYFPKTK